MLKIQAAISTDLPIRELANVLGPITAYEGIYLTRPFASVDKLKSLVGTAQARAERMGFETFGAIIQPYGVKPSTKKGKYVVDTPLKCKLDFGFNPVLDTKVYDQMPDEQVFYDRRGSANTDNVLISPNEFYENGLRGIDASSYYSAAASNIVGYYSAHQVQGTVVARVNENAITMRHVDFAILSIQANSKNFWRLNDGKTIEFTFKAGENTESVWVHLDSRPKFAWQDIKVVAGELARHIQNTEHLYVKNTRIIFDGLDGFYVMANLYHKINTGEAQYLMNKISKEYIDKKGDDRLTTKNASGINSMRLDASTMRWGSGLRVPYSLCFPTGLICLPVSAKALPKFERKYATIHHVLGLSRKANLDEFNLLPEERASVEKILGSRPGKVTGGDMRVFVKLYDDVTSQYFDANDPAFGERKFVEAIQQAAPKFIDKEMLYRMIDGYRVLADMPQYQNASTDGNGNGNGHATHLPAMDITPPPDVAEPQPGGSELENLRPESIDFILDLSGKVSQEDVQQHIKTMLGVRVPIEKIEEFIGILKLIRGKKV